MRSSHALISLALSGLLFACGGASPGSDSADGQTLSVESTCDQVRDRLGVVGRRVESIDTSEGSEPPFAEFGASFRALSGELDRPVVEEAQPMMSALQERVTRIATVSEELAGRTPGMLAAPARLEELGQVLGGVGEGLRAACQPPTDACRQVGATLQRMEFDTGALDRTIEGLEAVAPPREEDALQAVVQAYLPPLREMREIAQALEAYNEDLAGFQAAIRALESMPEADALCGEETTGGEG